MCHEREHFDFPVSTSHIPGPQDPCFWVNLVKSHTNSSSTFSPRVWRISTKPRPNLLRWDATPGALRDDGLQEEKSPYGHPVIPPSKKCFKHIFRVSKYFVSQVLGCLRNGITTICMVSPMCFSKNDLLLDVHVRNRCLPHHPIFLCSPKLKGRDDFRDNGTKKNHQQFSTNEDLGDVLIR